MDDFRAAAGLTTQPSVATPDRRIRVDPKILPAIGGIL
jgi:hypothetical protein